MKIEFNDPYGYFGTNSEAVTKVNKAMALIGSVKAVKIGGRILKNAVMLIEMGPDKWQTRIRLKNGKDRTIGWYRDEAGFGDMFEKPLELIY